MVSPKSSRSLLGAPSPQSQSSRRGFGLLSPGSASRSLGERQFSLRLHDESHYSGQDVVVNKDIFPRVPGRALLQIADAQDKSERGRLLVRVTELSMTQSIPKSLEISILTSLADAFGLSSHTPVVVSVADEDKVQVDSVELTVRGQYIGSSEMWRLKLRLLNSVVHLRKPIEIGKVKAHVNEIRIAGAVASCGVVTEDTKCIFRSRSAEVVWMIELSTELWDFSEDGRVYFDKILAFMSGVLDGWATADVDHVVAFVLFARGRFKSVNSRGFPTVCDKDYYITLANSSPAQDIVQNQSSFFRNLKIETFAFSKWMAENKSAELVSSRYGCLLGAVNLALDSFEECDRNLKATGRNIVVMTAGNGIHHVNRDHARITKHRMMDCGIACDVISVAEPPSHVVPLFVYDSGADVGTICAASPTPSHKGKNVTSRKLPLRKSPSFMEQLGSSLKSAPSVTSLPDVKHYSVPDHWMHIRFVGNRRKRTISRSGSETEDSPVIPMFGATVDREKAAWTEEEMMCHDNGIFVPPQSSLRSSPSIDLDTGRQTPVMAGDQMTLRAYVEQSQRVDFHQRTNSGIPAQTKDKLGRQTKVKPQKSGSLPNSEPGISALARVIRSEKEVDVSPDPNEGPKPDLHGHQPLAFRLDSGFESKPASPSETGSYVASMGVRSLSKSSSNHESPSFSPFRVDHGLGLSGPARSSASRRRWAHAVPGWDPSLLEAPAGSEADYSGIHWVGDPATDAQPSFASEWMWKSLIEPAILPLTTDYAPDTTASYIQYNYSISLPLTIEGIYGENVRLLLQELVCQRMTLDYQVVVGRSDELFVKNVASKSLYERSLQRSSRNPVGKGRRQANLYETKCFLSKGRELHELALRPESESVDIKRFIEQKAGGSHYRDGMESRKWNYRCFFWSPLAGNFTTKEVSFSNKQNFINWNNLDQLLASGLPDETETLQDMPFRRLNFAVVLDSHESSQATEARFHDFWMFMAKFCGIDLEEPVCTANDLSPAFGHRIQCSKRTLRVELMSKSESLRREWLILEYESPRSTLYAFHFSLAWIVADGASVNDFVSALLRRARMHGVAVHVIPASFVSNKERTFEVPCRMNTSEANLVYIVDYLTRKAEFVLCYREEGVLSFIRKDGMFLVSLSRLRGPHTGTHYVEIRWMAGTGYSADNRNAIFQDFAAFVKELGSELRVLVANFIESLVNDVTQL